MRYAEIDCGVSVKLPDGRTGKVVAHDANVSLDLFGGGGFVRRPERGLKATVRCPAQTVTHVAGVIGIDTVYEAEDVEVLISRLKKA